MPDERVHERVPFRFLSCPECRHQICWINPRLPTYCPECGKRVNWKERVMMRDDDAVLTTKGPMLAGGEYVERKPPKPVIKPSFRPSEFILGLEEAHGQGLHDELPREFCPMCERR